MKTQDPDRLQVGEWQASRATGELRGPLATLRLEPKVVDLLFLLASRPNEMFTREELLQQLWPATVVGDDALARLIFKLRRALGDDPKAPRFVETLPKRGYRLRLPEAASSPAVVEAAEEVSGTGGPQPQRIIAAPAGWRRRPGVPATLAGLLLAAIVALLWWSQGRSASSPEPPTPSATVPTVAEPAATAPAAIEGRANDLYSRYSRQDNEAAIELFERLIGNYPDYAPGYAGLANALVQRVMRWPSAPAGLVHKTLRTALADGHLRLPAAQRTLERAEALARQAVALAPENAASWKALGLVRSAREDFPGALAAYHRAIELDTDAWGAMINLGDLLEIAGREEEALPHLEAAFAAMTRVYDRQTPRIQPWYAETATLIGDRHLGRQRLGQAEAWYRRALDFAPLHPKATRGLANVLRAAGDPQAAARLCRELQDRLGPQEACGD